MNGGDLIGPERLTAAYLDKTCYGEERSVDTGYSQ